MASAEYIPDDLWSGGVDVHEELQYQLAISRRERGGERGRGGRERGGGGGEREREREREREGGREGERESKEKNKK